MELLTVEKLLAIGHSTSFSITDTFLKGELTIIKNGDSEPNEKETILLTDPKTQQSIHCNVDLMRPEFFNIPAIIKRWNFINCETNNLQFLEFKVLDVFQASNEDQPILYRCLKFDKQSFESSLEENVMFHTPESSTTVVEDTSIHIVGKIVSVSKIFTRLDLPTTFFVQLAFKNSSTPSAAIMFRAEALVEYYHMFCVGSLYAFNHLTRSSAFDTQEGLMSLFEYDEDISSVQMITPSQYENALQALNTNVSGVMKYGHENTTIDAYITRVVDTLLGVYEVNNSEIICLFKCPKYNALRPFRVSTKLRLHHVHRVSIKAYKSHNSNLFENLWGSSSYQSIDNQKIYGVVIACSRSDLQILSFPVHCDIVQTIHQWASTELLIDVYNKIVHLHILDVFRILEICTSLIIHFNDAPGFLTIMRKLTDCLLYDINVNSREKEIPNLAIQFLSNEIKCTTVDRPIANVFNHSHNQPLLNINHCLPVSIAIDYLSNNANEVNVSQHIGGYYSIDRPSIYTLISELDEGLRCPIFGLLFTADDGKIYLNDKNTKIQMKIACLSEIPISDGLYIFKKAQWVKEDLSYTANGTVTVLWHEYLCCDVTDMILIHGPEHPELTFVCRPIVSNSSVSHFFIPKIHTCTLQRGIYHVMYISSISPSKILSSKAHASCMRSVLDVVFYPINTNQSVKKSMVIELNSIEGGLKYKNMLYPLKWYVIEGPLNQNRMVFNSNTHRIYPIYRQREPWIDISKTVEFDYAQLNTGIYYNPRRSISTLDLISASKEHMVYDDEKNRTMDMNGILVSKSFIQEKKKKNTRALADFKKFGVGIGCDTQKLVARIRQCNTLETIDVYFTSKNTEYVLGLIVGTFVKFRNLLRPPGFSLSGKRYLICNEWTTVEIETICVAKESIPTAPYPKSKLISDLYKKSECSLPATIRITCSVKSFQNLTVKFVCTFCKLVVREGVCPESCLKSQKVCLASAVIEIGDGTGIAQAFVDGDRNLFNLLQLSEKQKKKLKRIAFKEGEISFSDQERTKYSKLNEKFEDNENSEEDSDADIEDMNYYHLLKYICHHAEKPQIYLYGSLVKSKANRALGEDGTASQIDLLPLCIREGENVFNTFVRKKPVLRVIEVENFDPAVEAWKYFQ